MLQALDLSILYLAIYSVCVVQAKHTFLALLVTNHRYIIKHEFIMFRYQYKPESRVQARSCRSQKSLLTNFSIEKSLVGDHQSIEDTVFSDITIFYIIYNHSTPSICFVIILSQVNINIHYFSTNLSLQYVSISFILLSLTLFRHLALKEAQVVLLLLREEEAASCHNHQRGRVASADQLIGLVVHERLVAGPTSRRP